jgi:hypothetical protein
MKTALSGIQFVVMAVAAILMLAMPVAANDLEEEEVSFEEAKLYFELNDTDGDLGFHGLIDGDAWKRLTIEDPYERKILRARVRGRLSRQGLTEFFFESAEPSFDELSPERFFRRFPEGIYEIEGITLDGEELDGEVDISHVMPAPPVIYVNNEEAAESCDAELPEVGLGETVIITWEPVTESHPDLGKAGNVTVHNYEVVVEIDDTPWRTSAILTPDATSFQVPPEILDMAIFDDEGEAEVKFEVLVRANNHNQTAVESCFVIVAE